MSGIEIGYAATRLLRACYGMSGTEIRRCCYQESIGHRVEASAHSARCYARPTRCPVLTQRMQLDVA
eukprot:1889385-Rhodomonas_salina.3